MKNILYYFSGTGNSLATAKDISERLSGNTEVKSIALCANESDEIISADRIGIVFPVYAWGVPEIIGRFVKKLTVSSQTYIFAIATCGGTPGGTLGQLNRLLRKRGNKISIGFTVSHQSGNLGMETAMISFVRKLAGKKCRSWTDRVDEICQLIERREKGPLEQNNFPTRLIGDFFSSIALKMFSDLDKVFSVNETCNGCGICTKICPVGNITIINSLPSWNHQCQQCLACVHWCPKSAIEMGETSKGRPRYHNSNVMINEMIGAKK